MPKLPLVLTVPPDMLGETGVRDCTIAHMTYRMSRGPHLFRASGFQAPRGGLMALHAQEFDGTGNAQAFCQEVMRECTARSFRGVLCDFEPPSLPLLERIVQLLGEGIQRRGWSLYVPEHLHHCSPYAKVMVSSAISGGSLEGYLEEAAGRYGRGRTVLAVQRIAEDFFLPSPKGSGVPLSYEELDGLFHRLDPSVFFSRELCARYFTYMSRDTGAHFVLFDDADTLGQKLKLARRMELGGAVLAWPEIRPFARDLSLGTEGPD